MKIFIDDIFNITGDENATGYHLEEEETNYQSKPYRDALYIVVPITILYITIFLTGVVGNISTCIVIARNKHMHTATNYYLFSLAISDLLLLLSGLPPEVFFMWQKRSYIFGEVFCRLQSVAAETSANATVLTITAFTIERYVAICHPFQSHTLSKLSRAVKFVIAIWISALGLAVPQAIQYGVVTILGSPGSGPPESYCTLKTVLIPNAFLISICVFFVIPMTVITVLYVLIGLKLRKSKLITMKRPSFSKGDMSRHRTTSSQRHVIRMLVAVVVGFFICWAPFHAQRLVAMYGHLDEHPSRTVYIVYNCLTYISGVLYYLSTTINPLLYHIMSHKFRDAFKSTLVQLCNERKKKSGEHRSRKLYLTLSKPTNRLSYNNQSPINMVSFHNIRIRRNKSIANGNLHQVNRLGELQRNEGNQRETAARASNMMDSSIFFQDDGLSPVREKPKRIKLMHMIKEKNIQKNRSRGSSSSSQMTLTTSYSKIDDEGHDTHSQFRETDTGKVKFSIAGYKGEGKLKEKGYKENCACWKCNRKTRVSSSTSKRSFKSRRSSPTLETIAKKFRFLTAKNKFSRSYNIDSSAHSYSYTNSKCKLSKTLSSYTISNTSLQDLDKSEFTCSELAHTMGQMKYNQEVQV